MAAQTIPDVLGGVGILGRPLTRSGELAEMVREGLPVKSLFLLADLGEDRDSAADAYAAHYAGLAADAGRV
jgi:hypothetical protein